jgi:LmbE family N-acetylglucosaminyl deacetylase
MKILVIAAHPDDETLGCGGAIARHVAAGDAVAVVFLTDGVASRLGGETGTVATERRYRAMHEARDMLGVHRTITVAHFQAYDNTLDTEALLNVVQELEPVVADERPDIVYTHHGGDLNIDHRIVHQASMTALRPQPGSTVKAIYAYEVPSSTEWASDTLPAFRPNHFVDISGFMEQKLAALQAYEEEMRPFPHPRSIEAVKALAAWRGASVGLPAAEAFMTVRSIQA